MLAIVANATRVVALALLVLAHPVAHALAAQNRADENGARLTSVARTATELYNAAPTTRANGAFELARGTSSTGDVAVLNGPVTIAGTVNGTLVAINADVRFAPGARIAQHLIVIGGTITGQDSATIGGEVPSRGRETGRRT